MYKEQTKKKNQILIQYSTYNLDYGIETWSGMIPTDSSMYSDKDINVPNYEMFAYKSHCKSI